MENTILNFWMCTSSVQNAQEALTNLSFVKVGKNDELRVPSHIKIQTMIIDCQSAFDSSGAILVLMGVLPVQLVPEIEGLRHQYEDKALKENPQVKDFIKKTSIEWQSKLKKKFGSG